MDMSARQKARRPEPTFAEMFTPKLVTILREGYGWEDFRADADPKLVAHGVSF